MVLRKGEGKKEGDNYEGKRKRRRRTSEERKKGRYKNPDDGPLRFGTSLESGGEGRRRSEKKRVSYIYKINKMRTGRVESISSWKRAARGKLKSEQKTKKRERLSILDKYGINRYLKGQRWWWAECGPDGWMWAAGRMSHRPICTSPSSFFSLLLTVLPLSSFLYYLFLLHPRPEFAKVFHFFSSFFSAYTIDCLVKKKGLTGRKCWKDQVRRPEHDAC